MNKSSTPGAETRIEGEIPAFTHLRKFREYDFSYGQNYAEFNELAQLATSICEGSTAFVNLLDEDSVWALGHHPISSINGEVPRWPLGQTLCERLASYSEPLVVTDVQRDPRTADWYLQHGERLAVHLYIGLPLMDDDGMVLGSLAVVAPEPITPSKDCLRYLEIIRNQVLQLMVARRARAVLWREKQEIAERQEVFERALEVASQSLWMWDMQTNVVRYSRNRSAMLGFESGQTLFTVADWKKVTNKDDHAFVEQALATHISGHTPEFEAEYRQRHRDGHWVWIRSRGRVTERDPATGQALRMLGTEIDVTNKKSLEARVLQMNEDLLQLARSLPDAVLQLDAEGRWMFANPRAEVVFASRRGEPPDEFDREAWAMRSVQVRQAVLEVDGRPIEFEVTSVPIFDASNKPRAILINARDLQRQREQEEALRRWAVEAEETVRYKTQFLSTMAHEIRTPLNSVVGGAQLALTEEDPQLMREHLVMVNQASQMLLDLLNTVLDHSRLESGVLQTEQLPLSVRQLLTDVERQMQPAIRAKGLNWNIRVDASVPALVLGDSLRLRQVLINLISNALKFTDQGGIEVFARVEPSSKEDIEGVVCIDVSDSGIGLSPEQQYRLFKAFSQADPSIARRYGGTGLGLSISREIMQALGGTVSLVSETGHGSTFAVSWPLRVVQTAGLDCADAKRNLEVAGSKLGTKELTTIAEAGSLLTGRRVLVVDDNRMNITVVRRLLERVGADVAIADSGSDALKHLGYEPVDAVLLDLYMPEMNGDEVALRIRNDLGMHQLPVIALSASVTQEERERCAAAGMDDFLPKPIDPVQLVKAIASRLTP